MEYSVNNKQKYTNIAKEEKGCKDTQINKTINMNSPLVFIVYNALYFVRYWDSRVQQFCGLNFCPTMNQFNIFHIKHMIFKSTDRYFKAIDSLV